MTKLDLSAEISNFQTYLGRLSYYNAAEGDSYYAESEQRRECHNICVELRDELRARGVDTNELLKGHLAYELKTEGD